MSRAAHNPCTFFGKRIVAHLRSEACQRSLIRIENSIGICAELCCASGIEQIIAVSDLLHPLPFHPAHASVLVILAEALPSARRIKSMQPYRLMKHLPRFIGIHFHTDRACENLHILTARHNSFMIIKVKSVTVGKEASVSRTDCFAMAIGKVSAQRKRTCRFIGDVQFGLRMSVQIPFPAEANNGWAVAQIRYADVNMIPMNKILCDIGYGIAGIEYPFSVMIHHAGV